MQGSPYSTPEIQSTWLPASPCNSGLLWLTFFFFSQSVFGDQSMRFSEKNVHGGKPLEQLVTSGCAMASNLPSTQRAPRETAAGLLGGHDTIIKKLCWLALCLTLGNREFQEVRECRARWVACVVGLRWHRQGGVKSSPSENCPVVLSQGPWHLG